MKLSLLILAASLALSCGSNKPTPDHFFNVVVDCGKTNPSNPEVAAAVYTCLANAAAGNPSACLSGLLSTGHWTVDEIACVVRELGNKTGSLSAPGSYDANAARSARNWIAAEKIGYR
jgi:hypothetical protein